MRIVMYHTPRTNLTKWNECLQHEHVHSIQFTTDVSKLLTTVKQQQVDALFIELTDTYLVGLSIAEEMIQNHSHIKVVFISNNREDAVSAYDLGVFDYILMPAKRRRIKQTVQRLINDFPRLIDENRETLMIQNEERLTFYKAEKHIEIEWQAQTSEQLLMYFLQNKHKMITIEQITTDVLLKCSAGQLFEYCPYEAIYNLRKSILPLAAYLEIVSSSVGYSIIVKNVAINIEQTEAISNSETSTNEEKTYSLI